MISIHPPKGFTLREHLIMFILILKSTTNSFRFKRFTVFLSIALILCPNLVNCQDSATTIIDDVATEEADTTLSTSANLDELTTKAITSTIDSSSSSSSTETPNLLSSQDLNCYVCSSDNDTDCLVNPVQEKFAKACKEVKPGHSSYICRKRFEYFAEEDNFAEGDKIRVIRFCGYLMVNESFTECKKMTIKSSYLYNCDCKDNLCNVASVLSAKVFHVMLVTIMPFLLLPS